MVKWAVSQDFLRYVYVGRFIIGGRVKSKGI